MTSVIPPRVFHRRPPSGVDACGDRIIIDSFLAAAKRIGGRAAGPGVGLMQLRSFGRLWPVSALTLGGGGLGMVWGETTFDECVATVHDAVAAGIHLIDLAPRYGDGKAEEVVGEAFRGRLPAGVRVTSKCNLGEQPAERIEGILRRSIEGSLERL